ncbi:MAG: hypothetical protein ACM3Q1_12830, partial [Bacteroidales bacterium]
MGDVIPFPGARESRSLQPSRELERLADAIAAEVRRFQETLQAALDVLGDGVTYREQRIELLLLSGHVQELSGQVHKVRRLLPDCTVAVSAGLLLDLVYELQHTEQDVSRALLWALSSVAR